MKITAIVERGSDGVYSIYTDAEVEGHGFGGFGGTVAEAKADFLESVEEAREMAAAEDGRLPEGWETVEVEYRYDIESFFNYFDWINVTQFAFDKDMIPAFGTKGFFQRFRTIQNGSVLIEINFLNRFRQTYASRIGFPPAGQQLDQSRFPDTVCPDNADFIALHNAQRKIFHNRSTVKRF